MSEHRIHVVPHEGGWTYKHEGGEPQGQYSTEQEAERAAKEHGRAHGDYEVVIHGRDGRIRDSDTLDPEHEGPGRDSVR
jgi:hypothetical protein